MRLLGQGSIGSTSDPCYNCNNKWYTLRLQTRLALPTGEPEVAEPLFHAVQRLLDGVEVGQFLRRRRLLAVLDDAVLVNDEGGARADRAQANQVRQQCAVGFGRFLVQVAGQGNAEFFLLYTCVLGAG